MAQLSAMELQDFSDTASKAGDGETISYFTAAEETSR